MKRLIYLLTVIALTFSAQGLAQGPMLEMEQAAAMVDTAPVQYFSDASEVRGAWSKLIRLDNGIAVEVHTSDLEEGFTYTVWWVIFNTPSGCSPDPAVDASTPACGEDDVFNADGEMDPNPDVNLSVAWATGNIVGESGMATFSAYLQKGHAPGEVLTGSGLTDPRGAEVHMVVRSHGRASVYRNALYQQLNSFEMTCRVCEDYQFSIHFPPS
ncbi:MAG: hypothetical protein JSV66_05415 [Trueperaceae bacterium]|nr:MAG: hypothetical protein JSV66_05415 [Trueperaceae bacterium]